MFEGYYGRRRLKTVLAIIIGCFVLAVLIYRRQGSNIVGQVRRFRVAHLPVTPPLLPSKLKNVSVSILSGKSKESPATSQKKIRGVLANIEFTNSPYLVLRSLPTNVVPIMVLSKAANIEVRDAIRRTWGYDRSYRNDTLRVKIFFLVGTDDFMTQRIRMEQVVFDDVIQVSLPDMYSFIAYKELSAMVWARKYLPDVPYYLKTEDDVILNMRSLVNGLLNDVEAVSTQQLILGWFGLEHVVQRGVYQKFIDAVVPINPGELYYAMSLLYVVTSNGADRMLDALSHIEFIEYPGDPFVTGILRDAAKVKLSNLATNDYKYELANGKCREAFEKNPQLLLCTSSLHTGSIRSMPEYFDTWNILIGQK